MTTQTAAKKRAPRKVATKKADSPMVGKWFHSVEADGLVKWQGQILNTWGEDMINVQLYSWCMGEPTNQTTVRIADTLGWYFYDTNQDMLDSWERIGTRQHCMQDEKREREELEAKQDVVQLEPMHLDTAKFMEEQV